MLLPLNCRADNKLLLINKGAANCVDDLPALVSTICHCFKYILHHLQQQQKKLVFFINYLSKMKEK